MEKSGNLSLQQKDTVFNKLLSQLYLLRDYEVSDLLNDTTLRRAHLARRIVLELIRFITNRTSIKSSCCSTPSHKYLQIFAMENKL